MSESKRNGNVIDVDFKEVKGEEEMNEEMKNTEANEEVETNDEQRKRRWMILERSIGTKKALIGVAVVAVVGGGVVVIGKIMKRAFEDNSVDARTVKDEVTEAVKEVIVTES